MGVVGRSLAERRKTPGDFLHELLRDKKADIDLPDQLGKMAGRLRRIKSEAQRRERATGTPALFLAWPFAYVPWEGRAPLFAPLFFWQVGIQEMDIGRQKLSLALSADGAPQPNAILEIWLKVYAQIDLDLSKIADEAPDNSRRMVERAAQKWGCENKVSGDILLPANRFYIPRENSKNKADGEMLPPEKSAIQGKLAIVPSAVLGVAYFGYLKLLRDLEFLADKVEKGEKCGLLDEFLNGGDVRGSSGGAPPESGRYLVEQSDASQEGAVWQARKSNVMLLKGPPGTGKSQTIVNLIADAMKNNESAALICRKPAALEVVKKRLDARQLGELAVKIADPLQQRGEIVGLIRAVAENENTFGGKLLTSAERKRCADKIADLEKAGDRIAKSRGKIAGKNYSARGHFLGKMEEIAGRTRFNPHASEHKKFLKTAEDIVKKFPEHLQTDYQRELKDFARDYETCNYRENPWREAQLPPEKTDAVAREFAPLALRAGELDDKRGDLPEERLALAFFGGMMRVYAEQFFQGEKRKTASNMARLISGTLHAFQAAQMSAAPPIWKKIFQGGGKEEYARYSEAAAQLGTVASINAEVNKSGGMISAFMEYMEEGAVYAMQDWADIMESVFCYWEDSKIPVAAKIGDVRGIYDELKEHVELKRGADAGAICEKLFVQQQRSAQSLAQKNLLRQNSSIRVICRSNMREFSNVFPAVLVNPDAMCQILPLRADVLDVAIVDEASQMFVADFLPILYRAKKVIVSGDNMQMPPDDTFSAQLDNDDDEQDGDSDSSSEGESSPISRAASPAQENELLEAMERWLPFDSGARCRLDVHYRSRPAELIAFSNHAFYYGKLQAAPANIAPRPPLKTPIEVMHAPGNFDRGINEAEIAEVIKCLRVVWSADKSLSTGVIVFNVKQARRLMDGLAAECEKDSEFNAMYEHALNLRDNGEDTGFFARSVEHVQGDERDIIILATTYNNAGTYGPLSAKEKGRRRLNVAVTRAKLGMFVITSLDIGKISNEGESPGNDADGRERWYLWKFMEYARAVSGGDAEKSAEVLRSLNSNYDPRPIGSESESQFEKDVGDYIREIGYEIDYQVGEGGFRIDIGVRRKEGAGYLCGIECDGRVWHEGWRARQNDVWRQEILEGKGWNIFRIWSDEWYSAGSAAKDKLGAHLRGREEAQKAQ